MTVSAPDSEILVTAFSPRYLAAFAELLGVEGGHVNDPADRGGETKFGVSLRFLKAVGAFDEDRDGIADFDLDMDGDVDGADVAALQLSDARLLYLLHFWEPLEAESFAAPIGEMLFDQAVNGGLRAARKLLQRAVNACMLHARGKATLALDGAIGAVTRSELNAVLATPGLGMPALIEAFREAVRDRYRAIVSRYPAQRKFLRGWLARAERLGR